MNTPVILLVLLVLCAALAFRLYRRHAARPATGQPWPFYARRPRPSPHQMLYQRLVRALPGHMVLAQVELTDVLGVKRGCDVRHWRGRLRRLQYDFVVCTSNASVLAVIELEPPLESSKPTLRAQETKAQATAAAGLRLIRWPSRALPQEADIRAALGTSPIAGFEEVVPSTKASWWQPAGQSGD